MSRAVAGARPEVSGCAAYFNSVFGADRIGVSTFCTVVGELTVGELTVGELSVGALSVGALSVGVDELSVGVDELSVGVASVVGVARLVEPVDVVSVVDDVAPALVLDVALVVPALVLTVFPVSPPARSVARETSSATIVSVGDTACTGVVNSVDNMRACSIEIVRGRAGSRPAFTVTLSRARSAVARPTALPVAGSRR